MTEPVSKKTERDASQDLFDLPVEALNIPGVNAADPGSAMAAFALAEPEIAALANGQQRPGELSKASPPSPSGMHAPRLRLVWIAFAALVLGNILVLALSWSRSSPAVPEPAGNLLPTTPGPDFHPSKGAGGPPFVPIPALSGRGRARLKTVESALDDDRRAFARAELGRILLDIDALPAAEREDTRAQAELLVARILQDAADETLRSR